MDCQTVVHQPKEQQIDIFKIDRVYRHHGRLFVSASRSIKYAASLGAAQKKCLRSLKEGSYRQPGEARLRAPCCGLGASAGAS
jgi:hypothetical protein